MRKVKRFSFGLDVLIQKEKEGKFIAYCLQFYLIGIGKTQKEAIKKLLGLINTHIFYALDNDLEDKLFNPAPSELWDELARCKRIRKKEFGIPKCVKRINYYEPMAV